MLRTKFSDILRERGRERERQRKRKSYVKVSVFGKRERERVPQEIFVTRAERNNESNQKRKMQFLQRKRKS